MTREMSMEKLLVPSALFGTQREVKTKWKRVTSAAIKTQCWSAAVGESSLVPIDSVPGGIVLEGPSRHSQEGLHLFWVLTHLTDMTYIDSNHQRETNELRAKLIMDGRGDFWFCLSILAACPLWLISVPGDRNRESRLAHAALSGLLHWWPSFVQLESRFVAGSGYSGTWPRWARRVFSLCSELGVEEEELRPIRMNASQMTPSDVEGCVRSWLQRTTDRGTKK